MYSSNWKMCSKFKAWIAGEQLRIRMHTENLNLIKDRRYHLRVYPNCFKATEAITWLLETRQCPTREAAVYAMNILQKHGVIHHVCDDHKFKDEMLFFRFRKDDRTWKHERESQVFHNGEKIFNWLVSKRLRSTRDIEFTQSGNQVLTFYGKELVDWLIKTEQAVTSTEAIRIGKELLDYDIIRHIHDEFHFRDDRIAYTFTLNYRHIVSLSYVLNMEIRLSDNSHLSNRSSLTSSQKTHRRKQSSESETENGIHDFRWRHFHRSGSMESKESKAESNDGTPPDGCLTPSNRSSFGEQELDLSSSEDSSPPSQSSLKSVLIRHASIDELEDPDTPYVKRLVRVFSDSVGYGCVIRGEHPTYVQTVDPFGPAATAGVKVRQYIYSVNGEKVLDKTHKYVAKAIRSSSNHVDLVVMSHIRDASM